MDRDILDRLCDAWASPERLPSDKLRDIMLGKAIDTSARRCDRFTTASHWGAAAYLADKQPTYDMLCTCDVYGGKYRRGDPEDD